ncbi:MAG: potassium/proton antiporter [Gemmatimonadota bacterium]
MFVIDQLALVAALLLILGIVSSKFSTRIGLPVLVLFLVLGMLAGSEGIGGIEFENFSLAHAIGTITLAIILFDGGLRTPKRAFEIAWQPSLLLATGGVLITSVVTGLGASYILGIPILEGILLGSIVGSTDAAAVFSLLRSAGVHLKERLAATLEIESGSNDPMAVFLTVGLLEILLGRLEPGFGLLGFFLLQMGVGAIIGIGSGLVAVRVINRINLEAAGLYPVLTGACGMLAYGIAASLGGSGFLAIYLAGVVIGNHRIVFQRGTFLFHDGLAWAGQITMFVVLGLLSFPSGLLGVAAEGIGIALILIFIARPIAVFPLLLPFRFTLREISLVSWVGLKGAVPIILAIYPLLFGLPDGDLLFNVVFFVVLASAITQGSSVPWAARRLGLEEEAPPEAPVTLEITSLRDVDADIIEYAVRSESKACGRRLSQLALPDGVVVAMISRDQQLIPPRGSTTLQARDHVFVVLRPETRLLVDRVFSSDPGHAADLPTRVEFPLLGSATVADLDEFYGIRLPGSDDLTLDHLIRDRLGSRLEPGATITVSGLRLRVRDLVDGRVATVGIALPDSPDSSHQ